MTWRMLGIMMGLIPGSAVAQPRLNLGDFLLIEKGTLPIILSAPHGGAVVVPNTPERKGENVVYFVTVRDRNVDTIAKKTADALEKRLGGRPYVVIAKFSRKYADANRPPDGAYEAPGGKFVYDAYHDALKAAIQEVQQRWGQGILIDIHAQGFAPDAILRGTLNLKSVQLLRQRYGLEAVSGPNSILGQMEKKGYKVQPKNGTLDQEVKYPGGYITAAYGSHQTAVDAMQFEFGSQFTELTAVEKTATDLADALVVFAKHYLPEKPKKEPHRPQENRDKHP